MGVRITVMVLRVCAVIALILGILFWTGVLQARTTTGQLSGIANVHMLLGILVMLSLWVLGFFIARVKGGNIGLALGAIVLGLLLLALGWTQDSLLAGPGDPHWIIKALHLLLGLCAIGFGEMIAGRYKRLTRGA